ncbi:MAG: hypothetical protein R3F11_12070 [Verrucomicrobiales bacterium]
MPIIAAIGGAAIYHLGWKGGMRFRSKATRQRILLVLSANLRLDSAMPEAPPSTEKKSKLEFVIISAGLVTTALTLGGIYWINSVSDDFNIMGWYWLFVIPVGALLVGAAASSGYGLAIWLLGVRVSRGLLVTIILLQIAAYFVAQHIEFESLDLVYEETGEAVTFWEYFDFSTRAFAFQSKSGEAGEPLGGLGYALRLLEIGGFALGSVFAPLFLFSKPYCLGCRSYMRTKVIASIPASIKAKKISAKKQDEIQAFQAEQQAAYSAGEAGCREFVEAAEGGDAPLCKALQARHAGAKVAKLPIHFAIRLVSCPKCSGGHIDAVTRTFDGQHWSEQPVSTTEVSPEFVRSLES